MPLLFLPLTRGLTCQLLLRPPAVTMQRGKGRRRGARAVLAALLPLDLWHALPNRAWWCTRRQKVRWRKNKLGRGRQLRGVPRGVPGRRDTAPAAAVRPHVPPRLHRYLAPRPRKLPAPPRAAVGWRSNRGDRARRHAGPRRQASRVHGGTDAASVAGRLATCAQDAALSRRRRLAARLPRAQVALQTDLHRTRIPKTISLDSSGIRCAVGVSVFVLLFRFWNVFFLCWFIAFVP